MANRQNENNNKANWIEPPQCKYMQYLRFALKWQNMIRYIRILLLRFEFCVLLAIQIGEFKCNRIYYYECLLYMFDLLPNFFYLFTVTFAFRHSIRYTMPSYFHYLRLQPELRFRHNSRYVQQNFSRIPIIVVLIVFVRMLATLALWVVSRASNALNSAYFRSSFS